MSRRAPVAAVPGPTEPRHRCVAVFAGLAALVAVALSIVAVATPAPATGVATAQPFSLVTDAVGVRWAAEPPPTAGGDQMPARAGVQIASAPGTAARSGLVLGRPWAGWLRSVAQALHVTYIAWPCLR